MAKSKQYEKFEVVVKDPNFNHTCTLEGAGRTIMEVRAVVRRLLDQNKAKYAQVTGFQNGQAVMITGVRCSEMKQFAVATATRG